MTLAQTRSPKRLVQRLPEIIIEQMDMSRGPGSIKLTTSSIVSMLLPS